MYIIDISYQEGLAFHSSFDVQTWIPRSQVIIKTLEVPKSNKADFYSISYKYNDERSNYIFTSKYVKMSEETLTIEHTTLIKSFIISGMKVKEFMKLPLSVISLVTTINGINEIVESPKNIIVSVSFLPISDWTATFESIFHETKETFKEGGKVMTQYFRN